MRFQDSWWNISMSSLIILDASVFAISGKKTHRQTPPKTVPTWLPSTWLMIVMVSAAFSLCLYAFMMQTMATAHWTSSFHLVSITKELASVCIYQTLLTYLTSTTLTYVTDLGRRWSWRLIADSLRTCTALTFTQDACTGWCSRRKHSEFTETTDASSIHATGWSVSNLLSTDGLGCVLVYQLVTHRNAGTGLSVVFCSNEAKLAAFPSTLNGDWWLVQNC